jgi:hypothetical protein
MKLRIILHDDIITKITKNHSGENGAEGRKIPERSDEIPWRYTKPLNVVKNTALEAFRSSLAVTAE